MAHQAKSVLKVQCSLPQPMYANLMAYADKWAYSRHDLVYEALRQFWLAIQAKQQARLMEQINQPNPNN